MTSFLSPEIVVAQCPLQALTGDAGIIYGDAMHGQTLAPKLYPNPPLGNPTYFVAANNNEVVVKHSIGGVTQQSLHRTTSMNQIPNFGPLNGSYKFSFTPNPTGGVDMLDFSFYSDLDALNGVSTWDLTLISRHILNYEPFISPFQLISADVNNSSSITTFDISEIRKLLLGTYTNFKDIDPAMTSWRFVPFGHYYTPEWYAVWSDMSIAGAFSPNLDPPYPNYLNTISKGFNAGVSPVTLIYQSSAAAVKMGDVNFDSSNFTCEQLTATEERDLTSVSAEITTDKIIPKGQLVTIKIKPDADYSISSCQTGIRFNSEYFDFISLNGSSLPEFDKESFSVIDNTIRIAWLDLNGKDANLPAGQPFLEMTFESKQDIPANQLLLGWDQTLLPTNFYSHSGEVLPVIFDSEISFIPLPQSANEMVVFPTNFSNELNFSIGDMAGQYDAKLELIGYHGAVVFQGDITFINGIARLQGGRLGSLPSGLYYSRVSLPNGRIFNGKSVKN